MLAAPARGEVGWSGNGGAATCTGRQRVGREENRTVGTANRRGHIQPRRRQPHSGAEIRAAPAQTFRARRSDWASGNLVRANGVVTPHPNSRNESASSSQCLPIPSRGSSGTGEQNTILFIYLYILKLIRPGADRQGSTGAVTLPISTTAGRVWDHCPIRGSVGRLVPEPDPHSRSPRQPRGRSAGILPRLRAPDCFASERPPSSRGTACL